MAIKLDKAAYLYGMQHAYEIMQTSSSCHEDGSQE